MNYEGGAIGSYDNALMVEAVTSDVNSQNYKATLNGVSISTNQVYPMAYPENHKQVVFEVISLTGESYRMENRKTIFDS